MNRSRNRLRALATMLAAILPACAVARSAPAQTVVGTHITAQIDTPINYPGAAVPGVPETRWTYELRYPAATYLAIHFVDFDLGPGDYLIVSDGEGGQSYELHGRGKLQAGTFWARHVKGDVVLLELIVSGGHGGGGFEIDEFAAGDVSLTDPLDFTESVVWPDDRENAICYQTSHPQMYERGRAVVRLLISGSSLCTGSIVSPYNHVLTNNHCIWSDSRALNTDFELMAEADTCAAVNCQLCYPGTVFSGGTLLATDGALDFSLVRLLDGDPSSTYGHLEIDNRSPVVGEQIYIPQHPGGRAKEFAVFSTHPQDTGGVARVQSVTRAPCQGGTHLEVGYYADTEGGSSGSPVLAASNHKLIALHHCGGSINLGVGMDLIYPWIRNFVLGLRDPGHIAPGSIAVTSDSQQSGLGPANAIDADITTRWESADQAGSHWLQLDLGLVAPVTGFRVWHASSYNGTGPQNTEAFRIESAPDAGGPWSIEFDHANTAHDMMSAFTYASPQPMRHVRLFITDPGNDNRARIQEFEVLADETLTDDTPLGDNAALTSTSAVASSQYGPDYGAGKAIDGVISDSSKWTSANVPPPHTLTLDLGGYKPIAGFILRQPSAAGENSAFNAVDFSFQTARSMSGPWYTEARVLVAGLSNHEARRFVAPKDLRYVRLMIDDPGIDSIARVPEFEVIEFSGILAAFSAFPLSGVAPLSVSFTDLSAGDVTQWDWHFGDGGQSDQQNPTYQYTLPGTYTVSLSVTGPEGSDTGVKTDYIVVAPVGADFDNDGDVDMRDFGHLQACMSGAGIEQTDPTCDDADLDGDGDVDQDDYARFMGCLSGEHVTPPPACGG